MIRSPRGAYVALVVLTIIWGTNWLVMKAALGHADAISYNIARTLFAVAALFAAMLVRGVPLKPQSWSAIVVTGFFQTTLNMGSTTLALASGGAGRTSVLVFTMPFWTLLLAWPVLHERIRGAQWIAVACALAGLTLVVEPWNWRDAITPKLWAVLSGFGWAAGTVATKYYQRAKNLDMLSFIAWQMAVGIVPFLVLPFVLELPGSDWSAAYVLLIVHTGVVSTAIGFLLWIGVLRWLSAGSASLNMLAIPVIALVGSMAFFGERVTATEWSGIAAIGVGLALVSLHAWRSARADPRDATPTPVIEAG